jgi:hypothetical protein
MASAILSIAPKDDGWCDIAARGGYKMDPGLPPWIYIAIISFWQNRFSSVELLGAPINIITLAIHFLPVATTATVLTVAVLQRQNYPFSGGGA